MLRGPLGGWRRLASHRHGVTLLLAGLFLLSSFLTRVALLLRARAQLDPDATQLLRVLSWGLLYDLAAASWFVLPAAVYLSLLPQRAFASRAQRVADGAIVFLALGGLLFVAVAEWLFWGEFGARFNFIAIDYLVYTREVLGNVLESYPVARLLGIVAIAATGLFVAVRRSGWLDAAGRSRTGVRPRLAWGAAFALAAAGFHEGLDSRTLPELPNHFETELARNGPYAFFAAFRQNELSYERFYPTLEPERAWEGLRAELSAARDVRGGAQGRDPLREVHHDGAEARYNVVQITVESLSAKYLGVLGGKRGLTPELDALARDGMLFTNFHATGNRTVRGMEALTLGVPPTPGRSIVKRPRNAGLFTLGSVLRSRGYDTVFLYGGYGYFDNMNAFFRGNGYRVVDRASAPDAQVTFANAWGVSDEDLFRWALVEADADHAAGRPFFQFVMTTSNHRPFTYPDGRIPVPSGTGRAGAVQYTDWAIGEYFRQARKRPWFERTLFVIVADHCAGTSGRAELPVDRYRIPLIVYNPMLVAPRVVDRQSSQIDYPPTLLGLLHWSYRSRFYGKDILAMQPWEERALIATYESLGLLRGDRLVVLKPVRRSAQYDYDRRGPRIQPSEAPDEGLLRQAIGYYQTAGYLMENRLLREAAPLPGEGPRPPGRAPRGGMGPPAPAGERPAPNLTGP